MATKQAWRGWRWRFYGTQPVADPKKPVPVLGPPVLGKQKILDLLKFRPIDFAEIESALKENAGKLKEKNELENKIHFVGRCVLGTLSKEAGIVKDGSLATSAIKEKPDKDFFYLLVSNFALSTSTLQEIRMHFPRGVKVRIKHPRAVYAPKGRVILEVHNPMYIDFLGVELPEDASNMEEVWKQANKALEQKEYLRAVQLYTRCIENGYENRLEAHSNRCEAWMGLECYEIALEDAKKVHYLDRYHKQTFLRKARILSALGSYRSALECFQACGLADDKTLREHAELVEQKDRANYELTKFIVGTENQPRVADYVGQVRIGMTTEDGKGRGLFATDDIKAGRIILVWNAAAVAKKQDLLAKLMRICLTSRKSLFQFLGLNGEEVLDMSLFKPGSILVHDKQQEYVWFDAVPALEKLCSSYSFHLDDDPESPMGLWTLPAFINHSCVPNVSQQVVGNALLVRAARDIRAEEELTLPYFDVKMPLDDRMEWTMNRWGFVCRCMRCRVEARLHAQKAEFRSFHKRMKDAKSDEELRKVACEVEEQIFGLPSEVEKDWVRTSYYRAYRTWFIRQEDGFNGILEGMSVEKMMVALHETSPGYAVAKEMVALARSFLTSSDKDVPKRCRELIRKECVSVLGEQKAEFMEWFIDQLIKGVDFHILKT